MKVYYAGESQVEERECEVYGYPNLDNHGDKMYDNTHFKTPEQAWQRVLDEAEAWVSLEARAVRHKESDLAKQKETLIKATLAREDAKNNYQNFLTTRKGK